MKKSFKVVSWTLLALILMFGGLLLGLYLLFSSEKFDQEQWLSQPAERVEMVDNLLAEVQLKGMSREKIISLLGETEEEGYFKEENNFVYYLGDERGFISIDSEWLVIWFDNNDRVNEYEIKAD
ncbi:hypothetical protein [Mesobacillus subterraneus]|uniref:Outer membrane protein assembly factor BamE n=1 Tax=Mesobacillus subterraneus TaxID=285983 RepID=A0A427TWB6_9BACI|nr:hypothetical protein [Mesobacillus subterraneus]RSD28731.1 hypothetical protein EJA10_03920 [Mesobacillus subterraneus]